MANLTRNSIPGERDAAMSPSTLRGSAWPVAAAGEHAAAMSDPLDVAHDVAIGKSQPAADLVHVNVGFDPVAHFGGAGKVGRYAGCRQHWMGLQARRRAIAERYVAQGHQQSAMRVAAAVRMVRQDTPSHGEPA